MSKKASIGRSFFVLLAGSFFVLATSVFATDQKPALKDFSKTCEADRYKQPIGEFSVDVYCDDALGTNISIVKLKFDAPMVGPYTLTKRTWQGGDWAFSITSFMWGTDRKSLYVATEGYNGTGKAYYLDIETQTIQEIWSMSPGDCGSILTGMDKENILLQNIPCTENKVRDITIPIPTN
ncbi:hypothetical protein [Kiloniella majae]|uniref:hypothetical protein n=1 Tax=Kiloniella majae TaxID=1938558 RepID=UPI000A278000|nr:hypothetical protein [Kiloniella majae]